MSTESNQSVIVSVRNLVKEYKTAGRNLRIINDISIDIYQGEMIALTGASGSGKTTLLQLVGGLDKPTSGDITVGGQDLSSLNDRALSAFRNKTIGFVFQFFYLQPFLNLGRNIEVTGMPVRMGRKERRVRVQLLANRVGLSERLEHLPSELSGGQIQRAAIARALFNQPPIILADEPTGNLDSLNSREIISLFKSLRDEFGVTVIIATHDGEIAAQADRVITLKDGVVL